MNKFTNEELRIIMHTLNYYCEKHQACSGMDKYFTFRERINRIVDKCNHESDGMIYTSNPPQNKCKKCGEFYR